MDSKKETLLILMEECAEVAQAASKCIRFGGPVNESFLEDEIGDLICMLDILSERDMIRWDRVHDKAEQKREKLKIFSKCLEDLL